MPEKRNYLSYSFNTMVHCQLWLQAHKVAWQSHRQQQLKLQHPPQTTRMWQQMKQNESKFNFLILMRYFNGTLLWKISLLLIINNWNWKWCNNLILNNLGLQCVQKQNRDKRCYTNELYLFSHWIYYHVYRTNIDRIRIFRYNER